MSFLYLHRFMIKRLQPNDSVSEVIVCVSKQFMHKGLRSWMMNECMNLSWLAPTGYISARIDWSYLKGG